MSDKEPKEKSWGFTEKPGFIEHLMFWLSNPKTQYKLKKHKYYQPLEHKEHHKREIKKHMKEMKDKPEPIIVPGPKYKKEGYDPTVDIARKDAALVIIKEKT